MLVSAAHDGCRGSREIVLLRDAFPGSVLADQPVSARGRHGRLHDRRAVGTCPKSVAYGSKKVYGRASLACNVYITQERESKASREIDR